MDLALWMMAGRAWLGVAAMAALGALTMALAWLGLKFSNWLAWRSRRHELGELRPSAPGPADETCRLLLAGRLRRDDDQGSPSWQLEVEDRKLRLEGPLIVRSPLVRRWPEERRSEALADGAEVLVQGLARFAVVRGGYREQREVAVALGGPDDGVWLVGASPPRLHVSGRGWAWIAVAALTVMLLLQTAGGSLAVARARAQLARGDRDSAARAATVALWTGDRERGAALLQEAWRPSGDPWAARWSRALATERLRGGCRHTLSLMLRHGFEREVLAEATTCPAAGPLSVEAALRLGEIGRASELALAEDPRASADLSWLDARVHLLAGRNRRAAATLRHLASRAETAAALPHAPRVLGCLADHLDPPAEEKRDEPAPLACSLLNYDALERPRPPWLADIVLGDATGDLELVVQALRAEDDPAAAAERALPWPLPGDLAIGRWMMPAQAIAIDRATLAELTSVASPSPRQRRARLVLSLRLAGALSSWGEVEAAQRHLAVAAAEVTALVAEDGLHEPARARSRMALLARAMVLRAGDVGASELPPAEPGDDRLRAELDWLVAALDPAVPITAREAALPTMDLFAKSDEDEAMTRGGTPLRSLLSTKKAFLAYPISWVASHRLGDAAARAELSRFVRHSPALQACSRWSDCALAQLAAERFNRGLVLQRLRHPDAEEFLAAAARLRAPLQDRRLAVPLAVLEHLGKELEAADLPESAGG